MIRYVKAHACGNDFLVVEAGQVSPDKQREEAIRLCARNTGVGADGVEYLERTGMGSGRIRLFNADGSVAEISGNGTRCVAAWMAYQDQTAEDEAITLETDAGSRECRLVKADGHRFEFVSEMGVPTVGEQTVRLSDGTAIEGAVVSTGNPHFVIFVGDGDFRVKGHTWQAVGEEICHHPDFPEQTNVEFVRIMSPEEIEIRIFERGVGPTTSSGTGTCATAVATISLRGSKPGLRVVAPGGAQRVDWPGPGQAILLTGPAELISVGEAF